MPNDQTGFNPEVTIRQLYEDLGYTSNDFNKRR